MKPSMRRAATLIVLALVATVAVPIVLGGRDALAHTLTLPPRAYAVLVAVIATSWLARAAKLQLLMRRVGVGARPAHTFAMSLAIDFAFVSTPAGLGGYAAGIYYLRRAGASSAAATAVMAADQVLDLAFFALVLPLAGVALLWSDLPIALASVAFATGAAMLGVGTIGWLARGRVARWLGADNAVVRRWPALRRRQHSLQGYLAATSGNVRLLLAGGARPAAALAALTALQWLTRYGVLWVALWLLGERVPFALTLLVQALVLHAALWTGVPSGGGAAEIGLTAALAAWVPATTMATALLLWRLVTFELCLVAGLVAVLALVQRRLPEVALGAEPMREG
jgi:uncharacterized protein (TIRG00374 family)